MKCSFCWEIVANPVLKEGEVNIMNGDIERDVMVEIVYCSDDCKQQDEMPLDEWNKLYGNNGLIYKLKPIKECTYFKTTGAR